MNEKRKEDNHLLENFFIEDKGFKDINPVITGWERCLPDHSFGPAVRDCYLLHYIVSGKGTFKNERGEYKLKKGQLFLIRPEEVTYYQADEADPWYYIWIGFTGSAAMVFDSAPDVMTMDLRKYFENIKNSKQLGTFGEAYLAGQMFLIITELFGVKKEEDFSDTNYAMRAASYIERCYMETVTVERLAREMHISRHYLSRLFKKEYKMSVQEYIISVRMEHAAEFLKEGYSVTQTANMSGYADVFNFSKMFKKYYGYSPSKILKKHP